MDQAEIRLRLIEAAARNPTPHAEGFAAGIVASARLWEAYVNGTAPAAALGRPIIGVPKKP